MHGNIEHIVLFHANNVYPKLAVIRVVFYHYFPICFFGFMAGNRLPASKWNNVSMDFSVWRLGYVPENKENF